MLQLKCFLFLNYVYRWVSLSMIFITEHQKKKGLLSIYKRMLVLIKLRITNITGRPLQVFPFASPATVDTWNTPHTTSFSLSRILSFFLGTQMVWMIIKKICKVLKNRKSRIRDPLRCSQESSRERMKYLSKDSYQRSGLQ